MTDVIPLPVLNRERLVRYVKGSSKPKIDWEESLFLEAILDPEADLEAQTRNSAKKPINPLPHSQIVFDGNLPQAA